MKILSEDPSRSSVKLLVMAEDDLWTLKNVVRPGDRVVSVVFRRVEKGEDAVRSKETSRKPVVVTVRVEAVEFREYADSLRISGIIEGGGEDVKGEHQSINISVKSEIEIMKERWTKEEMDLVKESINSEARDTTIFVTLDDESAEIFEMRSYGLMQSGTIRSGKSGKAYETGYRETDFFSEITDALRGKGNRNLIVVLLGPGFTREHFLTFAKEKLPAYTIFSFATSRSDRGAVYEFMESERSEGLLKEARLRKEQSYVDEFIRTLGKQGAVAYGEKEVMDAALAGAVSRLLVTEGVFGTDQSRKIMENVRNSGGEIHILSSHDEPGLMVERFGGYCALLRYKLVGA